MSHRFDPRSVVMADRHYNRQKPGTPQFVPPGACLVFRTDGGVWVSSWPLARYTKHRWAGAWMNTLFRKEAPGLASEWILEAVAATREAWPNTPALGMVTFVDADKVRHKRDPGRCYLRAGFKYVGTTLDGLLAFQLLPDAMPAPSPAIGWTTNGELFATGASPASYAAHENTPPGGASGAPRGNGRGTAMRGLARALGLNADDVTEA